MRSEISMLYTVFHAEVRNLVLSIYSIPAALSLSGSIGFDNTTVAFEARLTAQPWSYAVLLEMQGLSELLDAPAMGLQALGVQGQHNSRRLC